MDLTKLNDILELAGAAVLGLHGVFIALRALVVVLDKVVALTPSRWDDSLLAKFGDALDVAAAVLDNIAKNIPVLRRKK